MMMSASIIIYQIIYYIAPFWTQLIKLSKTKLIKLNKINLIVEYLKFVYIVYVSRDSTNKILD